MVAILIRSVLLVMAVLILHGVCHPLSAEQPTSHPMLRLETGTYAAPIRSAATDASGRLVATASMDKTVRLWSIATGEQLKVLDPAMGSGAEGEPFAVATSPGRRVVVTGGWTGFQWEKTNSLYVFETGTGQLIHRVDGLPQVINRLAWSPDRRHVATGLAGANGIRVFETDDWHVASADADYGVPGYGLSNKGSGRLAATGYDGTVRLYDAELRRISKAKVPGGARPYSVAFSPNGTRSVESVDRFNVDVLSVPALRVLAAADTTGLVPPVIRILSPGEGEAVSGSPVEVRYSVRSPSGQKVTAIQVLVDGRPLEGESSLKQIDERLGAPVGEQEGSVSVPIAKDATITLVARAGGLASVPAIVRVLWKGRAESNEVLKPRLYVLAIGVSRYRDPKLALRFAAKDATDVAAALAEQAGGLYREVVVKVLRDEEATFDSINDELDRIGRETTVRDVALVFMSGHGATDAEGRYYFLPSDVDLDRLRRTAVSATDIEESMRRIGGKALMFIDTAHSGSAMGGKRGSATPDINRFINDLASAENGVVVFSASAGRETAFEREEWGHGAFSMALIEALAGKADVFPEGVITVAGLEYWLAKRVETLTDNKQHPTSVKPATIRDFPIALTKFPPKPQASSPVVRLEIIRPADAQGVAHIRAAETELVGRVMPPQSVFLLLINGQRAELDLQGEFRSKLSLDPGTNRVSVTAIGVDRSVASTIVSIERDELTQSAHPAGADYALVIGEQFYRDPRFTPLETPREDARAVATLLRDSFGFRTTLEIPGKPVENLLLIDKGREEILNRLADLRAHLEDEDRLLIYFAGHGTKTDRRGYWIPSSAEKDRLFSYIMDVDVTEEISQMKAKHVLIVSDSCYSGAMYRSDTPPTELPEEGEDRIRYLEAAMRRSSRQLLASGSDEPVVDGGGKGHSVFADEFIKALRSMEHDQFTAEELYLRIKPRVADRVPQTVTTRAIREADDRDGQFVFTRSATSNAH
jgi:uncharacterized caspase-like protein